MDLADIGKKIAQYAPLLGGAIAGGPVGVAGALLKLVAGSVGGSEDDPASISAAIDKNPEAVVKLKQIEADNQAKLQELHVQLASNELAADTARIESVNQTMRAEGQSEHWPQWSWRPFNGFLFGLTLFLNYGLPSIVNSFAPMVIQPHPVSDAITHAVHMVGWTPIQAQSIPEFVFVAWGSVLGVAAWHRGVMQRVKAGAAAVKAKVAGVLGSDVQP